METVVESPKQRLERLQALKNSGVNISSGDFIWMKMYIRISTRPRKYNLINKYGDRSRGTGHYNA